jgi:purine-nucleoside phosphorylase
VNQLTLDAWTRIQETSSFLRKSGMERPSIGIILGTGLGSLVRKIRSTRTLPFNACPHFPVATGIGHAGRVVYGKVGSRRVIAMEGRFHAYEGYSLQEVTYPVRVMKALGIRTLILSNAAGGLNPDYALGDLMLIRDHINLMGDGPLTGTNDDRLGPRFPDMSQPYDAKLLRLARAAALKLKLSVREGVYVGVKGPHLETRAEYRFLRGIGADAVGMSTIPEVIVGAHTGLKTLAISCITDLCVPDELEPVDIERILETARRSEPKLTRLVLRLIQSL